MTKSDLARYLAPLGMAFNRPVVPALVEVYLVALQGMSEAQVETAVARALRECEFFPVPAVLRELGGRGALPVKNLAMNAWAEVCRKANSYSSADIHDPAMAAAIEAMGGWVALHNDAREAQWVEKDFLRWYEHYAIQSLPAGVKHLAGQHEINNAGLSWAPPVHTLTLGAPKLRAIEGGKKQITDGDEDDAV